MILNTQPKQPSSLKGKTVAAVQAQQSMTRENTKHLLTSVDDHRLQAVNETKDLQPDIKRNDFIYICVICPIKSGALKMGDCV